MTDEEIVDEFNRIFQADPDGEHIVAFARAIERKALESAIQAVHNAYPTSLDGMDAIRALIPGDTQDRSEE